MANYRHSTSAGRDDTDDIVTYHHVDHGDDLKTARLLPYPHELLLWLRPSASSPDCRLAWLITGLGAWRPRGPNRIDDGRGGVQADEEYTVYRRAGQQDRRKFVQVQYDIPRNGIPRE